MFELKKLPYNNDSLEPFISSKTVEFHYGKHHQTYVNNLNNLLPNSEFASENNLETIIKKSTGAIFNNAAQVYNHTFYWESLMKNGKKLPQGELLKAIETNFGSFEEFKNKFSNAAITCFGSGWAWLVKTKDGKLEITQESNAGCSLTKEQIPLLTIDVWEHAYYIDYQNLRAKYVEEFWNYVNWNMVEERYKQAN